MSKIFILIGLPGSGKSTWINNNLDIIGNAVICSTDNMIDEWAANHPNGPLTYSEAFDICPRNDFEKQFNEDIAWAAKNNLPIVIDRTNLTAKGRRRILSMVPDEYEKIGVVFNVDKNVLNTRLENRAKATGKNIPESVINHMSSYYEPPHNKEFDQIITVKF